MTDRELLEWAAKAAGYSVRTDLSYEGGIIVNDGILWNPLTDDSDALRLAVQLQIDIRQFHRHYSGKVDCTVDRLGYGAAEKCGDDLYAATRRAIVRAAAEIGKAMR